MAYAPACHDPSKVGLIDLKVAIPHEGALVDIGTATDQIEVSERSFWVDVPGDRNGGREGPPIEVQFIGAIAVVSISLTSYNQANIDLIRQRGVNATLGTIIQSEVGTFMLKDKAMRLLLDASNAADVMNFWCAIPREPIQHGRGTKFSEYQLQFVCHRPPCGHSKADILWDKDAADWPP